MAGKKEDKRIARDRSKNKQEDNNPFRPSTQQAGGGSGSAADVTPPLGAGPTASTPAPPRHFTLSKRSSGSGSLSSDKDKMKKTKVGESSSSVGHKETASTGQFTCPHPTCGRVFTRRQGVNGHMHYHNKVRIDVRDDGVAEEGTNDISPREQAKQRMIATANQLLSKLTKDDNLSKHGAAATVCGGCDSGRASSSSSDPVSRRVVPTRTHLEFDIYRRPRDGTFTSARLRLELDFDVDPPLDEPEPEPRFDMNEDPPVDPESGFDVNEEPPPELAKL